MQNIRCKPHIQIRLPRLCYLSFSILKYSLSLLFDFSATYIEHNCSCKCIFNVEKKQGWKGHWNVNDTDTQSFIHCFKIFGYFYWIWQRGGGGLTFWGKGVEWLLNFQNLQNLIIRLIMLSLMWYFPSKRLRKK